MLSVVLYTIVAGVAIAAGRNVFLTARAASRDEGELMGLGDRFERLRVWRYRSVGVFLIAFGLLMGFAGVVSSWQLATG